MKDYRYHTPDGVSDLLPAECFAKKESERRLRQLFALHGYREIETPGMEYLDVFTGGGFVAAENLCKMTDADGRLIGLRYDGTIPAARVAAGLLRDEPLPLRLSYIENMYRFRESGGGRQKEFTQAGVELLGASEPVADAEVIALAIAAAREAGIEDMQVSLGQVEFFLGLMEDWGIDAENARQISSLIDRKDIVALEKAAERYLTDADQRELLLMLPALFGTYEVLNAFAARVSGTRARAALDNLREILGILEDYGCLSYISVDLGMLPGLDYYTGMIFKGFTYEIGFPIFSGGRYDRVTSAFGRDMPAVGFSMGVNLCLTALRRQRGISEIRSVDVLVGCTATPQARKSAIQKLAELRASGQRAILDVRYPTEADLLDFARQSGVEQVLFFDK